MRVSNVLGGLAVLVAATAFTPTYADAASASANGSANAGAQAGSAAVLRLQQNSYASPSVRYGGGYTVRNTPSVVPGTIYSMNQCSTGAAVGGSGPGIGVTLSFTHTSRECELQNWYTLAMRAYAVTHDPREE